MSDRKFNQTQFIVNDEGRFESSYENKYFWIPICTLFLYLDFWKLTYEWNSAKIFAMVVNGLSFFIQIPLIINIYLFNKRKHYR